MIRLELRPPHHHLVRIAHRAEYAEALLVKTLVARSSGAADERPDTFVTVFVIGFVIVQIWGGAFVLAGTLLPSPAVDTTTATLILAGITVVLAAATVWMAHATKEVAGEAKEQTAATRRALELNEEQIQLTRRAVEASEGQALEAARSRIDQRAHRLVVIPGIPDWPPFRDLPESDESTRFNVGTEFALPRDADTRLWFRSVFLLRNDGASTAMFYTQGSSHGDRVAFHSGPGTFRDLSDQQVVEPPKVSQDRYALLPGQSARIVFDSWRTVGDCVSAWTERASSAELSKMRLVFIVYDPHFAATDNMTFIVQTYPLIPLTHIDGHWEVASREQPDGLRSIDVGVEGPAQRSYPGLHE